MAEDPFPLSQPNVEDAGSWGSLRLSVRRLLAIDPDRQENQ
jgi:hypothetical protein